MKAIVKLDVPSWQIGQEVSVYFPDSMCKKGICEDDEIKNEIDPDAVPKVAHYIKGRLFDREDVWYCSKCKRIDDKFSVANYCWFCGAKIERGDEYDE